MPLPGITLRLMYKPSPFLANELFDRHKLVSCVTSVNSPGFKRFWGDKKKNIHLRHILDIAHKQKQNKTMLNRSLYKFLCFRFGSASPSFTSKQNSCNCCLLRGGVFNWKAKQTFTTTKLGTCAFKGSSKFVKVSVTFFSVLSAPRKQNKQKHLLGWKQESEDDARSVYLVVYRLLLTVCTS